jgi:hypothetical protein
MSQTFAQLVAAGSITTTELSANVASGIAKAWVNFNGTGTVAIRASYNVSSITDNGVGDYTVNFTTALADANYSVSATVGQTSTSVMTRIADDVTPRTASLFRIRSIDSSFNLQDTAQVNVAIFR